MQNSGPPSSDLDSGGYTGSTGVDVTSSAEYKVAHMSRRSRAYLINDNELESLGDIAVHITVGWSIVAFCFGQIIVALWDIGYTPEGIQEFAKGWMFFWGAVAFCIGIYAFCRQRRRTKLIDRIKQESFDPCKSDK